MVIIESTAIIGNHIAYIINFNQGGNVHNCNRVYNILLKCGYNPYEHNNKFDNLGRIIID